MSDCGKLGNLAAPESCLPTNRPPSGDNNTDGNTSLEEVYELLGIEWLSDMEEEPEPPWLWEGFLARGQITLMSGLPKVGKTTLLWHVLRQMIDGGDLGGRIYPARVLILSEEPRGLWARRRVHLPGDKASHIAVRSRGTSRSSRSKPTREQWEAYIKLLAGLVEREHFDLVVLDTWCGVGPVLDENSSGETVAALKPLHHLTAVGAAVLLIHHISKSDAPHGMGARGSNALPGEVDHVVEVRYREPESKYPNQRKLQVHGRYQNHDLVYELRSETEIVSLGSADELSGKSLDKLEYLISRFPGSTANDLSTEWVREGGTATAESTWLKWLQTGVREGRWFRSGKGVAGSPYRYDLSKPIIQGDKD